MVGKRGSEGYRSPGPLAGLSKQLGFPVRPFAPRVLLLVVASGLALPGTTASAVPPFENARSVVKTTATGERVSLYLEWSTYLLDAGPEGGAPLSVWRCDTTFHGPETSVAVQSSIACFGRDPIAPGGVNGVPGQAPGPYAAAAGAAFIYPLICVQGTTSFTRLPFGTDNITIPPTCFPSG